MSWLTLTAEPIEIDPDRAGDRYRRQRAGDERRKIRLSDGAGPFTSSSRPKATTCARLRMTASASTPRDPRSTGMGQRIVTAMAAKLDANAERDPADNGTRIVLRFRRAPASCIEIDQQRCSGLGHVLIKSGQTAQTPLMFACPPEAAQMQTSRDIREVAYPDIHSRELLRRPAAVDRDGRASNVVRHWVRKPKH